MFEDICIMNSKVNILEKITQSCLILWTPWTTVHQTLSMQILQARILKWVTMPSSRGLRNPGLPHSRQILYQLSYQGNPTYKKSSYFNSVEEIYLISVFAATLPERKYNFYLTVYISLLKSFHNEVPQTVQLEQQKCIVVITKAKI